MATMAPVSDETMPKSAKVTDSLPNTPGFPPAALYQPNSRPLSYAQEPASAGLPNSPTSPAALPALPPTPGMPANMNPQKRAAGEEEQDGHGNTGDGRRPQTQEQQAPQHHDFSHDPNAGEDGEGNSEPVWSPAHPCFPHPNPHVPLSSPLYDATRIIRIPRDWMAAGDLYPAFSTTYPEILIPWLSEASFRSLVSQINEALRLAFEPATGRAVLEGVLGLFSGWLLEDVGLVGPKRRVKAVEAIIDNWNAQRLKMHGSPSIGGDGEGDELVMVVPLRRTAYMSLDIQIPDPKIRVVGDDEVQSQASRPTAEEEDRQSGDDGGGGDDEAAAAAAAAAAAEKELGSNKEV